MTHRHDTPYGVTGRMICLDQGRHYHVTLVGSSEHGRDVVGHTYILPDKLECTGSKPDYIGGFGPDDEIVFPEFKEGE